MEKQGTKVIPIDKRQLLPYWLQLLEVSIFPHNCCIKERQRAIWHTDNHWSNEDIMKRYIKKIILPFVTKTGKP